MTPQPPTEQTLIAENAELRARLDEMEETLRAIRSGEADALVIDTPSGPQIFTLQGMDAELNRFRGNILEQVSDAVIVLDDFLHITYLNAAASQQYGIAASEALGRRVTEIYENRWLDPEDETAAMTILYETGHWRGENIHVKRNGESIYVESSMVRLHGGNGMHSGLLAVIRDITQRRKIEEQLHEQARQLREAAERKDEFLAMLGHELRNPLTPISNMIQLMGSNSLDESKFSAVYEVLSRNVKHILHLVDDLLDVTRITQGLVTLKRERIELAPLLHECCETVSNLTQAKQQTLHYALPEQPVYLEGDRVRLTQVFTNLLNNACKYTDKNGRIDLTVSIEGPSVSIRIQDNGMGISPELLPRIFDLFTQSARGLDRAEGGLGIGLTLVKKLIELHGGHIAAQSRGINQGSEFTVQLPRLLEPAAQAESLNTHESSKAVTQELRILLIDDNRDVTDSMAMLLEMSGYQVKVARNGPQGLSAAQCFKPDVVLLDIGLPGMDGYQVARKLREQPVSQHALIIALSGYATDENASRMSVAGFDHYLIKPADFAHIQKLIAGYRLSPSY